MLNLDVTSLQFLTFHKRSFYSIRETFINEKNLLNSKFWKVIYIDFRQLNMVWFKNNFYSLHSAYTIHQFFWQLNFVKCLMIIVKLQLFTTVFFHHFYIKNVGQCFYRQLLTWIHEVIKFQKVFFSFAIIKSWIAILINFHKLFKNLERWISFKWWYIALLISLF